VAHTVDKPGEKSG